MPSRRSWWWRWAPSSATSQISSASFRSIAVWLPSRAPASSACSSGPATDPHLTFLLLSRFLSRYVLLFAPAFWCTTHQGRTRLDVNDPNSIVDPQPVMYKQKEQDGDQTSLDDSC